MTNLSSAIDAGGLADTSQGYRPSWAPVAAVAASAAPAFVLPGWDIEPANVGRGGSTRKRPSKRALRWAAAVVVCVIGASSIVLGLDSAGHLEEAPIPDRDLATSPTAPVVGPQASVDDLSDLEPLHVFVPAIDADSEIVPTGEFAASRYTDFDSLEVPNDTQKSGWFALGGAVADNGTGTVGTTLLASHVTGRGTHKWGVLRPLYTMSGGELVYTKDAAGELAVWKVTEVFTVFHTEFPQEFWEADGVRQLVLTTCGDLDVSSGNYLKNIFVVAVPVDPETFEPFPAVVTAEEVEPSTDSSSSSSST